ncbi:MAG: GIN domain-containing protein [Legionella sp.]
MRKHVRLVGLIGLSLLLNGCSFFNVSTQSTAIKNTTISSRLPVFNQLNVNGRINLRLMTQSSKSMVTLHGDPRDLAAVKIKVLHHKLFIRVRPSYPRFSRIDLELTSPYINAIEYHGSGMINGTLTTKLLDLVVNNQGETNLQGTIGLRKLTVNGNGQLQISGIRSPQLLATISGAPKIKLAGEVALTHLEMNNNGWLSAYWLKSKRLQVRGRKKSFIQLAGVVDNLDLELWDKSQFYGRYLRATEAFVKTHNRSVAKITAIDKQHTLASDNSSIHFYHNPQVHTDFMAFNGAVLDLREWTLPFIEHQGD